MVFKSKDTTLNTYLQPIKVLKKKSDMPFQEHPQFSILADILARRSAHHAHLKMDLPSVAIKYFLKAFIHYLSYGQSPSSLRNAEILYFNFKNLSHPPEKLAKGFQEINKYSDSSENYVIVMVRAPRTFSAELMSQLAILMQHDRCRLLVLTDKATQLSLDYSSLTLLPEEQKDIASLLRNERVKLEKYHHVVIPEDLLGLAYQLSERFLGSTQVLEKTLTLLDSSAARAHGAEPSTSQLKSVVTSATLHEVLSHWINIPKTLINPAEFKIKDFTQAMQQKIFGQDIAINLLSHEFQQAFSSCNKQSHTLGNLLLAGSKHSGKKTLALALAEQLYQQNHMIFSAQNHANAQSLAQLKFLSYTEKNYRTLDRVITEKPYAIILIEDVELLPPVIQEDLQELLGTGYLHDAEGKSYSFKNALFVLTTTLGTTKLAEISKHKEQEEVSHDEIDLVQLVMSEQNHDATMLHHMTPSEIVDIVNQEIAAYIPAGLTQHLTMLPFLPLDKEACENILRVKLKELGKMLDAQHKVELGYAPEVIRFLTANILKWKDTQPISKAIKSLYFIIDQAIANRRSDSLDDQLLLQIDDDMQMLRADWIAKSVRQQA